MKEAKYIIFNSPGMGLVSVVFGTTLSHNDIVQSVQAKFPGIKPASAGFCSLGDDRTFSAYGQSVTLNLKSDPFDSYLLTRLFTDPL